MLEDGWGRELLIFLATAGIVVPLFGRLRFGVVPGFLIAGVALGPGGLGHLAGDLPVAPLDHLLRPGAGAALRRAWRGVPALRHRPRILHRPAVGDAPLRARRRLDPGRRRRRRSSWPARSRSAPSRRLPWLVGLALALSSTAIVTQVLLDVAALRASVGPRLARRAPVPGPDGGADRHHRRAARRRRGRRGRGGAPRRSRSRSPRSPASCSPAAT